MTTEIAAKEENRQAANRKAAKIVEAETQGGSRGEICVETFRQRYVREHLSTLKPNSQALFSTAWSAVESVIRPSVLSDIDGAALSRFVSELRRQGLRSRLDAKKRNFGGSSFSTISAYLAHVKVALRWAVRVGLLQSVPPFPKLKATKGQDSMMRSRPVNGEQFDRLLMATKKIRKTDYLVWRRFLKGMYLSGMRLGEAVSLSWDFQASFAVIMDGPRPLFRIRSDGEKGGQDRLLPMAPEFAEFLSRCPPSKRRGKVFRIGVDRRSAGRIVSQIGRRARVVTGSTGKTATAHDLRRSFGTRWAAKVMPADLQILMRHSSIQTTMRYYVLVDALELSERLHRIEGGVAGGSGQRDSASRIVKDRRKS